MFSKFGALRRLSSLTPAILEQALVSAAAFISTLILVRCLSAEDFVFYGILTSALYTGSALQGALILAPLSTLIHKSAYFDNPEEGEATLGVLNLVLVVFTTGILCVFGATNLSSLASVLSFMTFSATFLFRQYVRGLFFSAQQPARNLPGSIANLLVAVVLLGGLAMTEHANITTVLFAQTIAHIASIVINLDRQGWKRLVPLRCQPRSLLKVLPSQGWALVGALAARGMTDGPVFICASMLPPEQTAVVVATRSLMQPIDMALLAFGNVMRPKWAKLTESLAGRPALRKQVAWGSFGVFALVTTWFGLVVLCMPLLHRYLFIKYAEGLVLVIAIYRGVAFLPTALRKVAGTELQARGEYRKLSLLQLASIVMMLGLVGIFLDNLQATDILLCVAASEGLGLMAIWLLRDRAARPAPLGA